MDLKLTLTSVGMLLSSKETGKQTILFFLSTSKKLKLTKEEDGKSW